MVGEHYPDCFEAIVFETIGYQSAKDFYHGPAGLLMPPLGLAILWVELLILGRLLVAVPPEKPTDYGFLPQPTRPAKRKDAGKTVPRAHDAAGPNLVCHQR